MDKYNVGMPTTGYKPIYSEDIENDLGINPKKLDYVDIQRLSKQNEEIINRIKQDYAHQREELKKREREQINARLKEQIKQELLNEPKP